MFKSSHSADDGELTLGKAILWGTTLAGWWVFGLWGFAEFYDHPPNPEYHLADGWDVFYDTLALVTVYMTYFTDPVEINWKVEVARLSAAAFLGVSAFFVFAERLRDAARRAFSQLWRGHVVVIGLSAENRALIADLLEHDGKGRRVVAIDPTGIADAIRPLRRQGVVVLDGDPAGGRVIRGANMAHAAHVVISLGSDSANLEMLSRLRLRLTTLYPHQRVHVQVEDDLLRRRLKEQDAFVSWPEIDGRERVRVDLFSVSSLAAAQLFWDEPLATYADWRGQPQVHVVIVGFGATGEAVLLTSLQQGLYKDLGTPKVTVVDRCAALRESTFRARYPAIPRTSEPAHGRYSSDGPKMSLAFDIAFVDADIDQLNCRDPEFLKIVESRGPVTAVVVAVGADDTNLSTALALHHALRMNHAWGAPIYVRIKEDGGLVESLNNSQEEREFDRIIQAFGTVTRLCVADEILDRERSCLAESLHLRYLDRTADDRPSTMAEITERAYGDWPDIRETYRDANRNQAEHVPVKLRAAGLAPISEFYCGALSSPRLWGASYDRSWIETDSGDDVFALKRRALGEHEPENPENALRMLGELEHRRWMTDRLIDGWIYGPKDDPIRKWQPDLIDFQFLGEKNVELDVGHIRDLPKLIKDLRPRVDWLPEIFIGVVGPIYLSAVELDRIVEETVRHFANFCDEVERRVNRRVAVTLLSTLAPGSDCTFVTAASDVLAERSIPYRVTAPRPLPFEQYTADLDQDRLGENGRRLQEQFEKVRSSPALQWIIDVAESGDAFFDLADDQIARKRMYRRASAYITERADILYVVQRSGNEPGRLTAEALAWRHGIREIPPDLSTFPLPRRKPSHRRAEIIEI